MRRNKLYSVGWLLLLIFSDSGMPKHVGEYESLSDCQEAWKDTVTCLKKMADKEKKNKDCFLYCGQPTGFCMQGERLNAPGVLFPVHKEENHLCD